MILEFLKFLYADLIPPDDSLLDRDEIRIVIVNFTKLTLKICDVFERYHSNKNRLLVGKKPAEERENKYSVNKTMSYI